MLSFMKKVRNGILIGTGHALTVGLISNFIYPIASWGNYLGSQLITGTWNIHWLLGLSATGIVAAGVWTILPTILGSELFEEIKDRVNDSELFYLVTGFGVPLAIAVVSPFAGALSAFVLGQLSIPHIKIKIKGFDLNVISESEDSFLLGLLKRNQRKLERLAAPYIAPYANLNFLAHKPLDNEWAEYNGEIVYDQNDQEYFDQQSVYGSEDEEASVAENVPEILGEIALENSQLTTVESAQGSVLERVPFFGRYFQERPTQREIEPIGNPAGSYEVGGHNLRIRKNKD